MPKKIMGQTQYICDVCGGPFLSCDDHGWCGGCDAAYCEDCAFPYRSYRYGDEEDVIRCPLCFPTGPKPITKRVLLNYALEKLGMNNEELRAELKRARPAEFDAPQNTYTCQRKKQHKCAPKCTTLDKDDDDPVYDDPDIRRGLCCVAKWEAPEEWCDECKK